MRLTGFILIAVAATASSDLSTAERRDLERVLICPERLRSDAARLRNTERFVARFAAHAPSSRMGFRMQVRNEIMARKKCRRSGPQLGYTFPES